jgi:hypothetical protein
MSAAHLKGDAALMNQLRNAVEAASDDEGWAHLGAVGAILTKQSPGLRLPHVGLRQAQRPDRRHHAVRCGQARHREGQSDLRAGQPAPAGLQDPARREEGVAELRAAAEMGRRYAMYLLAWVLAIDPGRTASAAADAEAEHWLRTLLAHGVWDSRGYLWQLLDRPGREADYEEALGAAARLGDPDATHRLFVRLFGVQGREQEAEEALRASVAAGNSEALPELATLVGEDCDRLDEAESLFTQAIEAGTRPGHYFYGTFLSAHEGREADAERELRQAAADGIQDAWRWLGALLSRIPGRESDARDALLRGEQPGH